MILHNGKIYFGGVFLGYVHSWEQGRLIFGRRRRRVARYKHRRRWQNYKRKNQKLPFPAEVTLEFKYECK